MRRAVVIGFTCLALSAVGAFAQDDSDKALELKVAGPNFNPQTTETAKYTETFPTDVQVTALLWKQLKINAIEEQTQALRIDFEKSKPVKFQRQESLANRGEQQPEHTPALMADLVHF